MSNRDSLGFGELLPQDVVDIFAQEKHSKRGRKKRSHSLGRALVWLKAVQKRDDKDKTPAPPLLQENVFIEASRPEYLENLHTEALEGLKMMQQEETNNGMEFQDNMSTISNMTVLPLWSHQARVNIQALESWEKVRKDQDEEKNTGRLSGESHSMFRENWVWTEWVGH
ncbi:hypothetical protein KUCAC02_025463 [Chaenocephalus aceratus]|uniref:Uncharacterized protein n=1 Tax=Chaenocephalus aceratus TaxID=36190 RepID=A0ACB9VUY7_CHAAC|nr:hypothetical protein KUCAC02_025463 [Chaenocephalus aceratus]